MSEPEQQLSRRHFLQAAVAGTGCLVATAGCGVRDSLQRTAQAGETTLSQEAPHLGTGTALAGAEFGAHLPEFSNRNPGRLGSEYVYNSEPTVQYFADHGLQTLRIPFRWERLQPNLAGELNPAELNQLQTLTRHARRHGCQVILDLHNYGRYRLDQGGRVAEYVIDQPVGKQVPVTRQHLADLWGRIALAFAGEPGVAAYGVMNEPHDLGSSDWQAISQLAVEAIRQHDRRALVLVAGDGWSNSHKWAEINGSRAWIKDPANRTVYEAHCYFDDDYSGEYRTSYAAELARNPDLPNRGAERVTPFLKWCRTNRVQGFLGEYGVPPDPQWMQMLEPFYAQLAAYRTASCYWAAGEWWNDYPLSLHPKHNYRQHAPQLAAVLRK